ncbi:MAG: glycosyltransferase family 4 protein [Hyphomicrobium sp.]|nr:glycosyltransferase family 4 protein [Hyphomicrobium sp.]
MSPRLMKSFRHVFMSTDAAGGVWTYALDLVRALAAHGINVTLGVLGPSPSLAQQREAAAVASLDLQIIGLPLDWTATDLNQVDEVSSGLQQIASACGADLVHLNAPAHSGRRSWKLPLVVTCHSCVATWWRAQSKHDLPPDLQWRRNCTEAGLRLADKVIVPSYGFAHMLQQEYGLQPHLTVVLNGRIEPESSRRQPSHILIAGRLWDRAKNVTIIDEAADRAHLLVRAAGPVTGPNGEHAQLHHLTTLGVLSPAQLSEEYADAKIFVSVPLYEPFGLSVLEAAQHGCALVLSNISTLRELWSDAAVFVDPRDAEQLTNCLQRLNRDADLCRSLGRRAAEIARRYTPERMLVGTLRAYNDAVASHFSSMSEHCG